MKAKQKIRIMHVVESGSGVARCIQLLIKKMDRDRFEHILVCPSPKYDRTDFADYVLANEPVALKREIGIWDIPAMISVRKLILRYQPDILYAHSSKAGGVARLASLGTGVPCIYNPHGWAFNMRVSHHKIALYITIERFLSRFCRKIVCVSEAERQSALDTKICGDEKLKVIENGIDLNTEDAQIAVTRKALKIPENAFVIGMTANYHPQKAPETFIKMAVQIKKMVPNAFFLIVGGGWNTEKIKKLAGADLTGAYCVTGWVKDPLKYMRIFDIAVLLSRYEAFGLVLAEYMFMQKPIVATRADAIPFIISDRENGLLVEVDDVQGICGAVMELYEDRTLRTRLAANGFRQVHQRFDADRMAAEHAELMEEIVGERQDEKEGSGKTHRNLADIYKRKSLIYKGIKRFGDIVLSSAALVCLFPFLLVTAAAVTLEDGKSPFFVQERMGKDMKPFHLYKFRSMHVGADKQLQELLKNNEQSGRAFKIREDPRITKIGKFIRKFSIDELPQLVNVIKGDMSIVGPRPILTWQMEEADAYERQRLLVRPGLTCYWQIQGRSDIPWEEWVELDLDYIERMGIWTDIKMIVKTIPAIFKGEGSY